MLKKHHEVIIYYSWAWNVWVINGQVAKPSGKGITNCYLLYSWMIQWTSRSLGLSQCDKSLFQVVALLQIYNIRSSQRTWKEVGIIINLKSTEVLFTYSRWYSSIDLMVLDICTNHQIIGTEHFHHSQKISCVPLCPFCLSTPGHRQPLIYFLSLWLVCIF